ncbi:AraC family transcriptional regulator [Arundinibacter roseus]|uniref:AraC family transcriptional regulator n=1 Tax=Arundinibacter roseus TaxID=2070510 RepID=A0A4R4KD91_9BACT|nr:AraC family transcriptional regulator [Arundinibacter roseus]TDB65864.1 AraC family transcriptional regulator [Arundinibacter roseus]
MKTKPSLDISKHLTGRKLDDMVENRTAYALHMAELNIYETHARAEDIQLSFNYPVLASMIQGKKVMHLDGVAAFDFFPGQSVLVPGDGVMRIDFPEATLQSPTQCLALALSEEKIHKLTDDLNERAPLIDSADGWQFTPDNLYFTNDETINQLLNRLIFVCTEGNSARDYFAELILQELTIRLMQTKARNVLMANSQAHAHRNRLAYAIQYLRQHLHESISVATLAEQACMSEPTFYRSFKQQFGFSPIEFINRERIRLASELLLQPDRTITDVAFACGFNHVNYFLKVFRKNTGLTPTQYKERHLARLQTQNALWVTSESWQNGAF